MTLLLNEPLFHCLISIFSDGITSRKVKQDSYYSKGTQTTFCYLQKVWWLYETKCAEFDSEFENVITQHFQNKQQAVIQAAGNDVTVDQLIAPRQDHTQTNVWVTSGITSKQQTHTCNYAGQNFAASQITIFFRHKKCIFFKENNGRQNISGIWPRKNTETTKIFKQDIVNVIHGIELLSSRLQPGHYTDRATWRVSVSVHNTGMFLSDCVPTSLCNICN